jgi:hypothetical protein
VAIHPRRQRLGRAQPECFRWAVYDFYDPDNVLHVEPVKRDIPNAIFVHIIRHARIALSLKKMGGFNPLPWDRNESQSLVATHRHGEQALSGCRFWYRQRNYQVGAVRYLCRWK